MFDTHVAFYMDFNCPSTFGIHHEIPFHIKQNLYVQRGVGFVCFSVCFVLALALIWKEKK